MRSATACRTRLFTLLRHEAPVYWYDWEHGKGFWCITRYDDVVSVLKDWRTFSSETGATALEDLEPDQIEARKSMLDTDPPKHSSLRAIVNKGFTPRAVAAYEELLRHLTRDILDDALPMGEFDFIEEVAKQLPIQVLCRILGVPLEDDNRLIEWGDRMIGNTDPDLGGLHPGSPESAKYRLYPFRSPYAMELFNYGHEIAAERRQDPQDDLVSKLVMWEDEDGVRLTGQEFDTMFLLLVVAGNETTRQSIAHGMHALIEHPEARQQLTDDPSLMGTAVEEIMRWASPVIHFRRTVTTDTDLHGVTMREGDKVVVWLISGNYDEQQFPDPLTVRHHPQAEQARHVRPRRPPLLPGRPPGGAGDEGHVRGAAAAPAVDRADRPGPADGVELHERLQVHAGARPDRVREFRNPTTEQPQ